MTANTFVMHKNTAGGAAGANGYHNFGMGNGTNVEAYRQVPVSITGTFSKMYVYVTTNDRGASTLKFRINTADGNQSVTITASTTGGFEDASNTDTPSATDLVDIHISVGTGGTTFVYSTLGIVFDSSSGVASYYNSADGGNITLQNETRYSTLNGQSNYDQSTEAYAQSLSYTAGTQQGLHVHVRTNTRTTASTIRNRIDGSDGNQSISIGAGVTGGLQDTSNSDTLAGGELLNYSVEYGNDTNTLRLAAIGCQIISSDNTSFFSLGNDTGNTTLSASATEYINCAGPIILQYTTEADVDPQEFESTITCSNLRIYISSNSISDNSTISLRLDNADGNQVLTITGSTTGAFEDVTNTDTITTTSKYNYKLVGGATGTSLSIVNITAHLDFGTSATIYKYNDAFIMINYPA